MLRVDSSKPCKIVYSLCKHEYLGYLIEPHIVQLNPQGDFSLTYQRLFSHTAKEFTKHLSESDLRVIKILDETEQDHVIKKFHKKAIRPFEFFSKFYDDGFYESVRPRIEKKLAEVLEILKDKDDLYLMDKDGWPAERKIELASEPATILFHFRRSEEETRYFPTIKYQGLRIEFMFKDAQIVSNQPSWMLLNDVLYFFEQDIEGKKLVPFLNKRYISIPTAKEETYFEKFVAPLIEKYHVYAEGFEIKTEKHDPSAMIKVIYVEGGISQIQLCFCYGDHAFAVGNEKKVTVHVDKQDNNYVFTRIKRDTAWEKMKYNELIKMGLKKVSPLFYNLELNTVIEGEDQSYGLLNWVNEHIDQLKEKGYTIEQSTSNKKFLFASSKIDFEIKEDNDWFDINAIVYFGIHPVPFISLKQHILHKKREFTLPDGTIAIIPEKWFSQYGSLFSLSDGGKSLKLKKHHIGLINDLAGDGIANITLQRKLQKLNDFENITDTQMPVNFKGELRSYQKAGYNWFSFLREYNFGGCLADDMGLGKTIQTLAMLQKLKEEDEANNTHSTSLIVMPTSLIYNWLNEAKKFTPRLKILAHTGSNRNKDVSHFIKYDIVITTYGITRVDVNEIQDFYFNYIILDESQNIKNPSSKSFKAVRLLKSRHKLVLSGTPVENSVGDLWTQLTFLNPGLLGTQAFFNEEYVQAIEKRKDEDKAKKLQAIIKPFVLRRTKEQVAEELPAKTEQIFYCDMSEDQALYYEKTKSAYRNDLLSSMDDGTYAKKQVQLLQGLTALRQLANHPRMIDEKYTSDSGKFENVIHTLDNVLKGGHKVLIFSQFVKHLQIFRQHLETEEIPFAYLDGATKNRGEIVAEFQENKELKVFLISIKAGGVGLNLTQADYVFILDPWWNPAVEQQAIDRSHRIGQEKKVFIYKFIAKDTVEEKILALQNRKKRLASSLITTEESFFKSLSKEDIREILN
ncbi:Helicase conserved C-terminal domain-containing protein [Pedobacter westerhofensis]|uniref:Helicase conserved C-terminal domain-containing protein n=1 Tax=Pedobacter westerhofensis TaxID=425512 RepID=A0A521CEC2_9SPHI|nr:SNF2-related protein [Pedobacter westerhofensis]SMO57779.1 Helicase conserved C-terminal domain-containing protein [Pedobacter westerhofensis]